MQCPICGENRVYFSGIVEVETDYVTFGFICKECGTEWSADIEKYQLKEVK